MRPHSRTNSYELEKEKREYFKEETPELDYSWDYQDYGYELDDPKHPDYYDVMADIYDLGDF